MHKENPIGIFDSGVGGLTIYHEIDQLLPNESKIYLADSKNAPYGKKPKEEILRLSIKNTEFLLNRGCKIIVVACNTATTNAISWLRKNYEVHFIGIEPAIKPAALASETLKVGVLATQGTLASELFNQTSKKHAAHVAILEREANGLVELIEAGEINSLRTRKLLSSHLDPMLEAGIDRLVLGCTHFPFLTPIIKEMVPDHVKVIDSGLAVAKRVRTVLIENGLLNTSTTGNSPNLLYTNGHLTIMQALVKMRGKEEIGFLDF